MKQDDSSPKDDKAKIKALREERKDLLERNIERLKKQNQDVNLIKKELKNGPRTVPAISATTGLPSDKVLWYVMSMKKYGEVEEGDLVNGYFNYVLLTKPVSKEEPEE
ncbi:MAG: winged helix-turn-helix domain-containing protein [Deltaproteobacteria bacterium]|nr:winged helix-turn-helix domain-containing protein [Deltaproteobacteria bacterium]